MTLNVIWRSILVCTATLLLAGQALAQESHRGTARMIDGDTIAVNGPTLNVRLYGIDAPEGPQRCLGPAGNSYDCGAKSAAYLGALLENGSLVTCTELDRDRYNRIVAECSTDGGLNLNREMVEAGWAVEFSRYSDGRYTKTEKLAKANKVGLWAGSFETPEAWRRRSKGGGTTQIQAEAVESSSDAECSIKGNISSSGQIYHRPGQADYDRTRINQAKGERWFCSAAEAEAVGWRAAKR